MRAVLLFVALLLALAVLMRVVAVLVTVAEGYGSAIGALLSGAWRRSTSKLACRDRSGPRR